MFRTSATIGSAHVGCLSGVGCFLLWGLHFFSFKRHASLNQWLLCSPTIQTLSGLVSLHPMHYCNHLQSIWHTHAPPSWSPFPAQRLLLLLLTTTATAAAATTTTTTTTTTTAGLEPLTANRSTYFVISRFQLRGTWWGVPIGRAGRWDDVVIRLIRGLNTIGSVKSLDNFTQIHCVNLYIWEFFLPKKH